MGLFLLFSGTKLKANIFIMLIIIEQSTKIIMKQYVANVLLENTSPKNLGLKYDMLYTTSVRTSNTMFIRTIITYLFPVSRTNSTKLASKIDTIPK